MDDGIEQCREEQCKGGGWQKLAAKWMAEAGSKRNTPACEQQKCRVKTSGKLKAGSKNAEQNSVASAKQVENSAAGGWCRHSVRARRGRRVLGASGDSTCKQLGP